MKVTVIVPRVRLSVRQHRMALAVSLTVCFVCAVLSFVFVIAAGL